jgi:hypothetical protein
MVSVKNTVLGKPNIIVYKINDYCFMDINDIMKLTRSTMTVSGNTVKIKHGWREISIDIVNDTIKEVGGTDSSIKIESYGDKILVHAYPLLAYLGATCTISNDTLVISMPAFTLWEALDFDPSKYALDAVQLYGSDADFSLRFRFDLVYEYIKNGVLANLLHSNSIYEEAVEEALKIDAHQYEGASELQADLIRDANALLENIPKSESYQDYLVETFTTASTGINDAKDWVKIAKELMEIRISDQVNTEITSEYLDAVKGLKVVSASVSGLALGLDIFATSCERAAYSVDTKKMLNAFTDQYKEFEPSANNNDPFWASANKINMTISSSENTLAVAAFEKTNDFMIGKMEDIGLELTLSTITSQASLITLSKDIAVQLVSLFPNNPFDHADLELNAMVLMCQSEIIHSLLEQIETKIVNEKFSNSEDLENYRLLKIYWLKTIMAANEKISALCTKPESVALFKSRNDELSKYLFMLTYAKSTSLSDVQTVSIDNILDKTDLSTIDITSYQMPNIETAIGYIRKIYQKDSKYYIDIDYVEWITDPAVIQKEATTDGVDYSGLDVYLVNRNTLIRTFAISQDAIIGMQLDKYQKMNNTAATSNMEESNIRVSIDAFSKYANNDKINLYCIGLDNGVITYLFEKNLSNLNISGTGSSLGVGGLVNELIIGKWKDPTGNIMQFYHDGTMTINDRFVYEYSILDNSHLKIQEKSKDNLGPQILEYRFDGDKLFLKSFDTEIASTKIK